MKRFAALAVVLACLAPASTVGAEEQPEIISVVDRCPVSEGGYQYSADTFEYRILVWLADCPWYHGERVAVRGSLIRTDPITGPERHAMTLYCEPGAPPAGGGHHAQASPVPGLPAPPVVVPSGAAQESEDRRPPDDCALSIVLPHPPLEKARYDGELYYPSADGTRHETLAVECTNVHQFGGCDPV